MNSIFTNSTFTNATNSTVVIMPTSRKYIAQSGVISSLTPKEKVARQIRRKSASDYGFSTDPIGGASTVMSGATQFFSPQLSTDFLELPQSIRERREIYRHYYKSDPLVGQAIDLHTELPLSKVRLAQPKPNTCPEGFKSPDDYGKYILSFFQKMVKRIHLFQRLILGVHHYWLDGTCLSAKTLVSTQEGEKRADKVKVGDFVLAHDGSWLPVQVASSRRAPKLLGLDIARLPYRLDLTPDHPIEVIREGACQFIDAGDLKKGDFVRVTWPTKVEDVTEVDILTGSSFAVPCAGGYSVTRRQFAYRQEQAHITREKLLAWLRSLKEPTIRTKQSLADEFGVKLCTINNVLIVLKKEVPVPFQKRIGPVTYGGGSRTLWYPLAQEFENLGTYNIDREYAFTAPTQLTIDEDFLYVLGYWLGDGSIARGFSREVEWGRGTWSIAFGKPSLEHLARIREILARKLGTDCLTECITTREDGDLTSLQVKGHPVFVEWWASMFGETSHGYSPKHVPSWVLHLPKEKNLAVLAGLIDSDGCASVSSSEAGIVALGMTSARLISSARDLMLRVGVVPSYRIVPPSTCESYLRGRLVKSNRPVHNLTVDDEVQCRLVVCKADKRTHFDVPVKFANTHRSFIITPNGDTGFLVQDIVKLPSEVVYNIQVQELHTFRAGYISTHNCAFWAEDSTVEIPQNIGYSKVKHKESHLTEAGDAVEKEHVEWAERDDKEDVELAYYQKHYKGLDKLLVLPIDQVSIKSFSFTDKLKVELIPSAKDRELIEQAKQGDPVAEEMVQEMPAEVLEHLSEGRYIPLGTDPDEGSFVYLLKARHGADEAMGTSILDRCLRTLNQKEKLRQAQSQIASRNMTPKRIVWAEGLSETDTEGLREQVDLSLVDPDYSIVTNYEVHWEELGSRDRLLDISSEYEHLNKDLLAGLGVTESLMSGESLYSGDRLKLEVINTRYMLLREVLQEYVEDSLFAPVARRKGFIEKDAWGDEVVLYPKLSFTRLPLRDSQDTFDALYNLYQKGSLSIDVILELFNIDAVDTQQKLEKDLFTVNDCGFNELPRAVYGEVGRTIAEKSDAVERLAKYMGFKIKEEPKAEEEGRF